MEDLMKDLAQARPPVPEVDRDRMERDLARIVTLPRERPVRRQFVRRFAPLLVIGVVIVLAVVLLPSPPQPVQPASTPQWWRVLRQQSSLMVVGEPTKPYIVRFDSRTDQWQAGKREIAVVQKDGKVEPFSRGDNTAWEAAGRPEVVPQLGGSRSVRIGPMAPAVQESYVSGLSLTSAYWERLESFDDLPADPAGMRAKLQPEEKGAYELADLVMAVMIADVRDDQRRGAFELLRSLDGVRYLDRVPLPDKGMGVGVAIPALPQFQFGDVETQFVINPATGKPILKRNVITKSQHGLPSMTSIAEERYLLLEGTNAEPILPLGVPVNGEVESPIIER
ncbi:hypothetical protein [Lentzea albidocapillata]|uniref:Uncharacterized protein n=1 Tax=Lentzea albidocapillata TaxID=40571 RepID=A0A1W2EIP5_9PSEU|nr:hypothetical protein [Lentzea albidocapillata]SMD09342.1 hypothetical protein SAMN05660733_04123 [Lentzea albidocapillata]